MSATKNTPAELFEHLKFITGQDNLSTTNGTRMFKYALNDYSAIAMSADGVQKFDGTGHGDYPVATSTVSVSNPKIELDKAFLQMDRVTITLSDGSERPLKAIDRRDHKDITLLKFYGTGTPTAYDIDANSLEVFPHPEKDYTVTVYYTRAAKHMDVTDDTNDVGIRLTHHYYLILHAARQMGFAVLGANRVDIRDELIKWEGNESSGRQSGGKIRSDFSTRDEDRPKRLRVKNRSYQQFGRTSSTTYNK